MGAALQGVVNVHLQGAQLGFSEMAVKTGGISFGPGGRFRRRGFRVVPVGIPWLGVIPVGVVLTSVGGEEKILGDLVIASLVSG